MEVSNIEEVSDEWAIDKVMTPQPDVKYKVSQTTYFDKRNHK